MPAYVFAAKPDKTKKPNLSLAAHAFSRNDNRECDALATFNIRNLASWSGMSHEEVERRVKLRMQQLMDELDIEERSFYARDDIDETWDID